MLSLEDLNAYYTLMKSQPATLADVSRLITVLEQTGTGGGSGSGEIIDLGSRIGGDGLFDLGLRV
jgi:hypothetical protein